MGARTLQFGLPHPEVFGAIGQFSVGLSPGQITTSLAEHGDGLDRRARTRGLVWYTIGQGDIFAKTVTPTRSLLDQHGVHPLFHGSAGGHTGQNRRDYLALFLPMLFR